MKILILGITGMAGHVLGRYLKGQGYLIDGIGRNAEDPFVTYVKNIEDIQFITDLVQKNSYDAIINCIAILNQDAEDNIGKAVWINAYLPHLLAELTKNMKTKIIQISTDGVFSGKEGNYTEHSIKDGTSVYSKTKALGELEDKKNLTIRTSIIGPDTRKKGIGLFNWFMKQNQALYGYRRAVWTGLTVIELAKVLEQMIKQNITGLYQIVPEKSITKYELLKLFNQYFRKNPLQIYESDNIVYNKALVRTNGDFSYDVPNYESMIADMRKWVIQHIELYPHYKEILYDEIN